MGSLAVAGGHPCIPAQTFEAATKWPHYGPSELEAVSRLVTKGEVSRSDTVLEFEQEVCKLCCCRHALTFPNGTLAMLAAMYAVGIGPGDEVLCPSNTWWGSISPALWLGASVSFCDCEPGTLCLDPEDVLRRITPCTKALVAVHLWGLPAPMSELRDLCTRHGIALIEDASHAHGARYKGTPVGSLGDIAVFSCQASKLLPMGEGGFLSTDSSDLYEAALLIGHGDRLGSFSSTKTQHRLAATGAGIKARPTPLVAALGLHQLRSLRRHVASTSEAFRALETCLDSIGGFARGQTPGDAGAGRVYYEFVFRYSPEHFPGVLAPDLALILQKEGVRCDICRYPLLHQLPLFRVQGDIRDHANSSSSTLVDAICLPVCETLQPRLLSLPAIKTPTLELAEAYDAAFRKVSAHAETVVDLCATGALHE